MNIKIELLSDTIFGNGVSIPGGEDIAVQVDNEGFPYMKGSTLRGIYKEELINFLNWTESKGTIDQTIKDIFGVAGDNDLLEKDKIRFSDIELSKHVKDLIKAEIPNSQDRLEAMSYLRTFTKIDENGMASEGSLRVARCLKKGLIFYGTIDAPDKNVKIVLGLIKRIGTMRNRGFGEVKIEAISDSNKEAKL